jgi:adenosine deaminase
MTPTSQTQPPIHTDLHVHLGGAVPASVLWEILCNQGLSSPYHSFPEFQDALTAKPEEIKSLDDFLGSYFHLTETIQSSPEAIATSAYQAVAKAFRRGNVTHMELRFNPAKRLRGNLHSIDAILLAVLQGLERASAHYNVTTAAILSLGRDLPQSTNRKIVEAAIRWKSYPRHKAAGIVAIDMAGPESTQMERDPAWMRETLELFRLAQEAGLKTTYHIGETDASGWIDTERILNQLRPDRIGHGIQIRKAPPKKKAELLEILRDTQTCLEICPTVNQLCRSAKIPELQEFCSDLFAAQVPFSICTDNPYLAHTNIQSELEKGCVSNEIKSWAVDSGTKYRFGI